ncbi:MAG TPA: SurA N-terminal domain-containing protein [Xanthobacteraceae bacterium]|nr:SurA N-terminal domain-containing protein [Xanthobacteraceae bacterium]
MLRGIRNASSGWLGKTIMAAVVGFLVISFGIWGIGDIFRGYTRGSLVTVGDARMSADQFRQLFNTRLQALSRQVQRPITPEQARAFGVDRQVLSEWIQNAALDQYAQSLRLGIPEADVVQHVTEDPMFRIPGGQFDAARFQAILSDNGLSEQGYIADQRRETLRRQLMLTLTANLKAPAAEIEALNRYQNEQRDADFVVLTPAQAGDIPPPAPDVLAKYFEERKVLFRAPEYRKATILALTPDAIAPTIEIADADVKAIYDKNPNLFGTPEKRDVQQILFFDKDAAHKAAERLKAGTSFDDLIKDPQIKDKYKDLGMIAKYQIADDKVADAAFTLPVGQASGAIDGLYNSTIVRVTKIEPGNVKPFAEAAGEIKKNLALQRARDEIKKMRDKVDDQVGSGTPLDQIAKSLKLPVQTIAAIDRSGRGPDGKPIALPKGADLIGGIFSADVNVENDALQTQDGGVIWYNLDAVTPSRDRTLDEVKDQVTARWHDEQVIARLNAKAKDMLVKLKAGAKLADLAAAEKVPVEKTKWLKRRGGEGDLPASAVAVLFQTAKGEAAVADGKQPTERIVMVVNNVTVPAFDASAPDVKQLADALRESIGNDVDAQFVGQIESNLKVSVDQNELNQALGTNPQ